jgi:zinc transport system ATP-binding protein
MHLKAVVEIQDVRLAYGEAAVLEGVSLCVAPGDFLGILGPNGSGKTTLLRVMLGLLAPDSGAVRLFGQELAQFRDWGRIGYVPQLARIDATVPTTVQEVVATGLVARRRPFRPLTASGRARVDEVLGVLGMQGQASARIGRLSAGQQQRVLIARALATEPELLVLDEPTGSVDPEMQGRFYAFLRQLNRQRGVTLILVSHDIGVVTKEITKLACLNRRLIFHGSPEELGAGNVLADLYGSSMRPVTHHH